MDFMIFLFVLVLPNMSLHEMIKLNESFQHAR
jgi:hypothetical protein